METSTALDLAHAVMRDGFAAHEHAVAALAAAARRAGVRPVPVEVLADPSAPEVVRQRALGRVIVALDAALRAPLAQSVVGQDVAPAA